MESRCSSRRLCPHLRLHDGQSRSGGCADGLAVAEEHRLAAGFDARGGRRPLRGDARAVAGRRRRQRAAGHRVRTRLRHDGLSANFDAKIGHHRLRLSGVETLHGGAGMEDRAGHYMTSNAPSSIETLDVDTMTFCEPLLISMPCWSILILRLLVVSMVMLFEPEVSSSVIFPAAVRSTFLSAEAGDTGPSLGAQKQPLQMG